MIRNIIPRSAAALTSVPARAIVITGNEWGPRPYCQRSARFLKCGGRS
jgi:hypothetical protein